MNLAFSGRALVGLTTFFLLACGGSPPPSAPPGPASATPKATAPPPDLSRVPEPASLLLVARIGKPDNVIHAVGSWTRVPLPSGKDLARSSLPDPVADVVDFSEPVDAAATLAGTKGDPSPLLAIALAVPDYEGAKAKLGAKYELSSGPNGQEKIEGIGKLFGKKKSSRRLGDDDEDDEEHGCVLAPAVPKGAKLVCGEEAALEALVPYMTRTLPREQWSSDVHLEIRPAPAREPLERLRAMIPVLARSALGNMPALGTLADSLLGEMVDLVGDVNRFSIDATFADAGVDAVLRVDYQRAQSMIAKLATSRSGPEPAPPAFFHLPQESDVGFFGTGSDPKLWDHPRELIGNVLLELGTETGMPDADKRAFKDLLADRMMPLFTTSGVYGKGFDPLALARARAEIEKARDTSSPDFAAIDAAERAFVEQAVGWHLYQTSEPISKVGPILKDWANLWKRPSFTSWLKTRQLKTVPSMRLAAVPAGVTLPKETVHLEIAFPLEDLPPPSAKAKPQKRPPLVLHVFAVPDEGKTWLAFGLDGKLVAQRAAASLSAAPAKDTIAQTPGLEAFKDGKMHGGGYFTMRGLLVLTALEGHGRRSPFARLDSLPNKGKTPITMTFTALPATARGGVGSSTSNVRVPRAVLEDVVALAMGR